MDYVQGGGKREREGEGDRSAQRLNRRFKSKICHAGGKGGPMPGGGERGAAAPGGDRRKKRNSRENKA